MIANSLLKVLKVALFSHFSHFCGPRIFWSLPYLPSSSNRRHFAQVVSLGSDSIFNISTRSCHICHESSRETVPWKIWYCCEYMILPVSQSKMDHTCRPSLTCSPLKFTFMRDLYSLSHGNVCVKGVTYGPSYSIKKVKTYMEWRHLTASLLDMFFFSFKLISTGDLMAWYTLIMIAPYVSQILSLIISLWMLQGQSHQIMHLCVVAGAVCAHQGFTDLVDYRQQNIMCI